MSAGSVVHTTAHCQPPIIISGATIKGVIAAPSCMPAVCSPCTKAQRLGGNQSANTPADTGKIAAWERPSRSCAPYKAKNMFWPTNNSGAIGNAIMATKATSEMITNVRRAPYRCPNMPPGIWNSA